MNYIEHFIDFLDGNQDSNQESTFIKDFSENREFRENFRQYLALTKALDTSSKYFTPSDALKHSVFDSLGMTVDSSLRKKKSFFRSRLFPLVTTALVSFLLGYFLSYDLSEKKSRETNNSFSNRIISFSDIQESNEDIADRKGINRGNKYNTELESEHNMHHLSETNSKEQLVESDLSLIDDSEISTHTFDNHLQKSDYIASVIKSSLRYDTIFIIRSYDNKFRFEFKNTPSWHTNKTLVQPNEISRFNNLSITLLFPLLNGLLLGADFRQETFYLEYEGYNERGQSAFIYQQPNITTYSLAVRYSPFDISDDLRSIVQFNMGLNKYGYVFREMAAIEYYPFENVYFTVGAELNQFIFQHNKDYFSSSKFGLIYGIGVKF